MQVALVMFRPDGNRRAFPLTKPTTILGRKEDCDLRLPLSSVSRRHCKIVNDDKYVRIEDLGSANGTFVNHIKTPLIVLNPGDVISIGGIDFVIQIDGVPAEDDIRRPGVRAAKPPEPPKTVEQEIDDILLSDDPAPNPSDDSLPGFKP